MKKLILISLSIAMLLMTAACGSTDANNGSSNPDSSQSETVDFTGSLPDLINQLYEKVPVDIMLLDPTEVEISDADVLSYYTGLTDASAIKEAFFSEAAVGSQAYSMAAVRLNDPADAEAVANAMFEGIDTAKWICVAADSLSVAAIDDIVILAMVDSELAPDLDKDLMSAFAEITGKTPVVSLSK